MPPETPHGESARQNALGARTFELHPTWYGRCNVRRPEAQMTSSEPHPSTNEQPSRLERYLGVWLVVAVALGGSVGFRVPDMVSKAPAVCTRVSAT